MKLAKRIAIVAAALVAAVAVATPAMAVNQWYITHYVNHRYLDGTWCNVAYSNYTPVYGICLSNTGEIYRVDY